MTRVAKAAPNLLSPEQQQLFDAYIKKWQVLLGLTDWRIERSSRKTKNMAEVKISHPDRLATYRVGDFGSTPITAESIESTAIHECLHILECELVNQEAYGLTDPDVIYSAEHRVVNVLEKLLLAAYKGTPT